MGNEWCVKQGAIKHIRNGEDWSWKGINNVRYYDKNSGYLMYGNLLFYNIKQHAYILYNGIQPIIYIAHNIPEIASTI